MSSLRTSVRLANANARIQQEINNLILHGDGIQKPITRAMASRILYKVPFSAGTRKRRGTSLDTTMETVNYREKAVQRQRACKVPAKRPSPKMCQVANPPKRGRGRPPKAHVNTNKDQTENLCGWKKRATFADARDMILVLKHHMMQEAEIYYDDQLPTVSGTNLKLYTCILADSHECPFEMFSMRRPKEVTKFELYHSTKYKHNHANFSEATVNSFTEMNNSGENDSARVKSSSSNVDRVPRNKQRRVSNGNTSVMHIDESNSEINEPESSIVRNANRRDIDTLVQRNIPGAVTLSTLFDISSDAMMNHMQALAEDLLLKYTGMGAKNWFSIHAMTDEKTFFVTNAVEIDPNANPFEVVACERENGVTMNHLLWSKIDSAQFMWALRGKLVEYFFPFKILHRRYTTEDNDPSQRPRVEFEDAEENDENGCRNENFYLDDQFKLFDFEEFAYNHDLVFRSEAENGRTGFCIARKNRQIAFYDLQNTVKVVVTIGSKVTTEAWSKGDWSQFFYAVRGRSIKVIFGSPKSRQGKCHGGRLAAN